MTGRQHATAPETMTADSAANATDVGSLKATLNRRSLLKSLAGLAGAAALPPIVAGHGAETRKSEGSKLGEGNPAWYGFNLLEYFSTDPDWMKYFPYKNDGAFREDDFRWMRDWGFNFARLPMDYRFWTDPDDLMRIDEQKIEPIDRAVRLGEKYEVHINICLHRAPGFCILDGLDAALTGIHVTGEKTSFYKDPHTLDAFVHQWTFFAQRYKGIASERLSFNLVNEPFLPLTPAERAQLTAGWENQSQAEINRQIAARGESEYARVARAAIAAIRSVDPGRLIVTDGCSGGVAPVTDLVGAGVMQSPHDYYPPELTHYQCEWARGWVTRSEPPAWPLKDSRGKVIADRQTIEDFIRPWRAMEQQGLRIHFGEMGCYKHTPPEVVLAWFNDTLDAIGELHSGWALWNFRGPFGILDTERLGAKYEDWHGHSLDRALLNLLQGKMRYPVNRHV